MTAEEFARDEEARARLAGLLGDPVLQNALGVLLKELEPRLTNANDCNSVLAAARHHQAAGAFHIVNGLVRLTKPYIQPKAITSRRLQREDNSDIL